jgi:glycogen debranching enzyme
MGPAINQLIDYVPPVRKALLLPSLALASVVSKDGMSVYASSDTLFKGAVFGRDSLEVADDLLDIKPALVRNILLTLGKLQGLVHNDQNEEQPGKIIHEYRTIRLDGKPIGGTPLQIFHELTEKWGGNQHELAYYGSVDATPHFLRTLKKYCLYNGKSILQETVTQRDGTTVSMQHVAEAATTWLTTELALSESGLLEYKKVNPLGISNQVWKDSEEFYVHENGEMANHDKPIASIEVQGLTYDALMAAAYIIPEKAEEYTKRAAAFRDTTIGYLWQPKRHYFALGIDYSPTGELRIINTATANPAALLDTDFFTDLEPGERERYVSAIVKRITAKDFLTNAGIRSRSLDMAHLVSFWDYHGSYVTWPKETYDIARGLRHHGFTKLSRQLENRLLNVILKTHEYPEFVYVDEWGRVLAGTTHKHTHGDLVLVEGTNKPERLQAWTVSAMIAIMARRGRAGLRKQTPIKHDSWQASLENQIIVRIPDIRLHLNPLKLWLRYPTHKYHLSGPRNTKAA